MTPFLQKSVLFQNSICFWWLAVCFGSIADLILLLRQRRLLPCISAALCFGLSFFAWHVCREGTEYRLNGEAILPVLQLLRLPAFLYVTGLLLVSVLCVLLHAGARKWEMTHITASSVKESLDHLPAGICYYLEEGQCLLVNHRMNEISMALTGSLLQNGADLYERIRDRMIRTLPDGTAVSFRHRLLSYKGAPLHELIADDITELYKKSEELRRENEKAKQLAAGMKAYGETIGDTVRRQEILQAKINIHDEMNRMILMTRKTADGQSDPEERRAVLQMWRTQALLLCREAGAGKSRNVVSDLNTLAAAMGMRIVWEGLPDTESTRVLTLFLAAAREALANAAKHAGAGELRIRVDEDEAGLRAVFTNDGRGPDTDRIVESGGLKTLRRQLEQAGGQMEAGTEDGFFMSIFIPKEEKSHAI